jgi:hypothetical protein
MVWDGRQKSLWKKGFRRYMRRLRIVSGSSYRLWVLDTIFKAKIFLIRTFGGL